MGALVAVMDKRGKDATETAISMLKTLATKKVDTFGIASSSIVRIERTIEALQNQKMDSCVIIGYACSKILSADKSQPVELENAELVFEGRIYSTNKKFSDAELVAQRLQHNHEEQVEKLIKKTEGDYSFVIADPLKLTAGRDPIGIRPLHYGENTNVMALASERKALWKIGIEKVHSFPPGHIAFVDKNGFKLKPVRTLTYSKPRRLTMQVAAKELKAILQHSIEARVSGLKEIAVAFSGGLDSSIIAFFAKESRAEVHLIHASLENQPETEHAKEAAEQLKLPIQIQLFKEEAAEKIVPKVVELVEEPDPIKISIGIPLYWTAEKAAEMGFKVMLAGQGADELFGGYRRYIEYYLVHGDEKTRRMIFDEVSRLYETNLERDFKICNVHNVELRLPFAAFEMARFSVELPVRLKIEPRYNSLRKLVLRQAAEDAGLAESIVKRPKKAIQYATGINKVLKRIAKKNGLTVKEYIHRIFQERQQ